MMFMIKHTLGQIKKILSSPFFSVIPRLDPRTQVVPYNKLFKSSYPPANMAPGRRHKTSNISELFFSVADNFPPFFGGAVRIVP